MPKIVFPIASTRESVQRPVVIDIVRQVMEWTGIPNTTKIQFNGESDVNKQPGSTISEEDEFNTFGTDPKWHITVQENTQKDRILSTAVFYDDNPHVFYDASIRAYIRPVYVPSEIVISVTHRFTDHDSAMRWVDGMRSMISANRESRTHNVSYSYLIPKECIHIVKELHRLRENVAGYGQTFDTYLREKLTKKATILTNLIGSNPEWGIAETQGKILGYFEMDGEPDKGDKDPDHSGWSIDFTYTFLYDRPESCLIEYPLMVHNQLISSKFRDTESVEQKDNYQQNYSISSRAIASFESTRIPSYNGLPGISIPSFDEFLPSDVPPNTLRLVTLLSNIDITNPRSLLSLLDFDTYKLTPEVIAFLRTEYPYLCKLDQSIFNVSVYRFSNLITFDQIEVDQNLMVKFKFDPSLREVYHVRFAIHKNPIMLNAAAKERLKNNYDVAKQCFLALKPNLKIGNPLINTIMTNKDFNNALESIDDDITMNKSDNRYQFNTVMSLMIQNTRK